MITARRVGKIACRGPNPGAGFADDFAHAVTVPGQSAWAKPRSARLHPPYGLWRAALAAIAILSIASTSQAQPQRDPGEIHGLKLGLQAKSMTLDGFGDLACGSNGGPPRQRIDEWTDFAKCRPEASGLHEVSARFDDEAEYISKAVDDPRLARGKIGTRVAGHPVVLTVLFDGTGVVRQIRFVTDPRAAPFERRMAHILRRAILERYGPDGWDCKDLPSGP